LVPAVGVRVNEIVVPETPAVGVALAVNVGEV
jgi:hypothetical protein